MKEVISHLYRNESFQELQTALLLSEKRAPFSPLAFVSPRGARRCSVSMVCSGRRGPYAGEHSLSQPARALFDYGACLGRMIFL